MTAPPVRDEAARLSALRSCGVLDTLPEAHYDGLARLAAAICGTPIALVSLVDGERQWFKARVGIEATQTPRASSFCDYALTSPGLFLVPDASADARFRDNPLVTGEPHIRFYAGVPLTDPEGFNLGTLCVIDTVPRELTAFQRDALGTLAGQVAVLLEARRQVARLERARASVDAEQQKFRAVVDGLAEGVLLIDAETKVILDSNAAATRLFGYSPGELATRTLYDLCTHDPASVDANCERVRTLGRLSVGRRRYRRNGGALLDLELSASLIDQGGRQVINIVFRDVGEAIRAEERLHQYQLELERANEQLRRLAVTDGLTGVKNRAAFDARLAEAHDRATRYRQPLSVVLLDVDHFKAFNDAFGHPAGDEVLKAVAAAVAGAARASDTVARYGGEEFVVVLPDTDYAGAMALAERCRRAVAGANWSLRPVTVSVGVSTLTPDTPDAAALVREADVALYRSKQAGRNRVNHGSGAVGLHALTRAP